MSYRCCTLPFDMLYFNLSSTLLPDKNSVKTITFVQFN